MSLLTPEPGLVFWMTIAFGFVVVILAKFAFPTILKSVEKRTNFIEESLQSAREANAKLAKIEEIGEEMLAKARKEQKDVLKEALKLKSQIIREAHDQATKLSDKMIEDAREQIDAERVQAVKSIRGEITSFSIELAEKILREKLSGEKEQMNLIKRLVEEIDISKS